MTAADLCRERGWVPGDVLKLGYVTHQITAIGQEMILIRFVAIGRWTAETHRSYLVDDWQCIGNAPLDETPPRKEWFE